MALRHRATRIGRTVAGRIAAVAVFGVNAQQSQDRTRHEREKNESGRSTNSNTTPSGDRRKEM